MRVINLTNNPIVFSDLDRGLQESKSTVSSNWNEKCPSVVDANSFIDVLDTEKVMLSTELGQIKKMKESGKVSTKHSMTGNVAEKFSFSGETFKVIIGNGSVQSFSLSGTGITAEEVAVLINATAVGFVAEASPFFFRSSFVDNVTSKKLQVGELGDSMAGARGPAVVSGFLVLVSDNKITIGNGTANEALGFIAGDFTKAQ